VFFLLIAVAAITAAPLLAAILVTAASLREDYDHSLAGRPPGPLTAAARWLLRARVGTGTGRPRRLRIRRAPPGRKRQPTWKITREPAGPRTTADSRQIPRPRRAAEESPYRPGPDGVYREGVHYDGVHPDGAEHAGSVPRR
jgi:hypothetical protein